MPPNTVHIDLNATLGVFEIGIAISTFLYGITTAQAYIYWCTRRKDPLWMILFVLYIWIAETLETIAMWSFLYKSTVAHFGDVVNLGKTTWYLAVGVALISMVAGPVQLFYAYRIAKISGRIYVTLPAIVTSLARFSLTTAACVLSIEDVTIAVFEMKQRGLLFSVWAVQIVADVQLTALMCYYLAPGRHQYAGNTRKIIFKLMLWTIESGLVTSFCAVLLIILFHTFPGQLYWLGILAFLPKMYSISLLLSLNARKTLRGLSEDDEHNYVSSIWAGTRQKQTVRSMERNVPIHIEMSSGVRVHDEPPKEVDVALHSPYILPTHSRYSNSDAEGSGYEGATSTKTQSVV